MWYISGRSAAMGDSKVYGGVEGGGTHSTAMIFDQVGTCGPEKSASCTGGDKAGRGGGAIDKSLPGVFTICQHNIRIAMTFHSFSVLIKVHIRWHFTPSDWDGRDQQAYPRHGGGGPAAGRATWGHHLGWWDTNCRFWIIKLDYSTIVIFHWKHSRTIYAATLQLHQDQGTW